MFFAMPAVMTARSHALPHPPFHAQNDTLQRIVYLSLIPCGNHRACTWILLVAWYGLPMYLRSDGQTSLVRHEATLSSETYIAARSNEQGHLYRAERDFC